MLESPGGRKHIGRGLSRFPNPPLYVLGVRCTGFFQLHSQSGDGANPEGNHGEGGFPGMPEQPGQTEKVQTSFSPWGAFDSPGAG